MQRRFGSLVLATLCVAACGSVSSTDAAGAADLSTRDLATSADLTTTGGCLKDTDCKSNRICVGGMCVAPGADMTAAVDAAVPSDAAAPDLAMADLIIPLALSSVSPARGPSTGGNTQLTLTGTGFSSGATVTIDGQSATVKSGSTTPTSMVVTLPAKVGTVSRWPDAVAVAVTLPGGGSVSRSDVFAYAPGILSFGGTTPYATTSGAYHVAAGDFNGDGNQDVATADHGANATGSTVTVRLGDGTGKLASPTALGAPGSPFTIYSVDVNGDAKPDLVTGGYNATSGNGTAVYGSLGTGSFASEHLVGPNTLSEFVAFGDLDGDGKLDLVAQDQSANTLVAWYGYNDGTFATGATISSSGVPALADLDGDGKLDLISVGTGGVAVYPGTGNGANPFGSPTNVVVTITPYSVETADLDGDGNMDIVLPDYTSGKIEILFGMHSLSTWKAVTVSAPNVEQVRIADLNLDGHLDLIAPDDASPTTAIFLGTGTQSLAAPVNLTSATGSTNFDALPVDLNDDGLPDLAIADFNKSQILIQLNTSH